MCVKDKVGGGETKIRAKKTKKKRKKNKASE